MLIPCSISYQHNTDMRKYIGAFEISGNTWRVYHDAGQTDLNAISGRRHIDIMCKIILAVLGLWLTYMAILSKPTSTMLQVFHQAVTSAKQI